MKRRGFFGALVGLCLGALGVKAKPPAVKWRKETVGVGFDLSAETGEFIRQSRLASMKRLGREMELATWGPLT